jgi:acyl-coenzyme A synthetase/AMP-(fatty) acid ligase
MLAPASIFGLQRTLRTLWSGCTVVEPNLDGDRMASWLVDSGVTFITLSPIGLRRMLECLPARGVRCALAMIEIGGGLLPPAVEAMVAQRLPAQIVASYGSTETGPMAAAPMAALAGRPGAVGFPYPGVEIEVVDDEDRPLPAGREGFVRMRAAHAASAYMGDAEAGARVFRGGWVYPNDNAVIDADGAVRLLGRTDDVINVNGVKVNPQALEDILMTLADLREAAVFSAPDATGMAVLCAAIVGVAPINGEAFHERCRAKLGRFSPALIMHLQALPRNAMGKVLRTELSRMALAAGAGRTESR